MSFQWTIVAAFLYAEIAVVLLLLLPFVSPKAWNRIFKSRFFKSLSAQADIYFTVMIVVLLLFFFDSIREMRKYGGHPEDEGAHHHLHANLDAEMQQSMRMFRAQRNFYIAGFSLFLWLVIRRLVTLIGAQAVLLAENEAAMRQARSATEVAEKLMKQGKIPEGSDENKGNSKSESLQKDVEELSRELEDTRKELARLTTDRDALKVQAANLGKEYDRLCEELSQARKKSGSGDPEEKKDM